MRNELITIDPLNLAGVVIVSIIAGVISMAAAMIIITRIEESRNAKTKQ